MLGLRMLDLNLRSASGRARCSRSNRCREKSAAPGRDLLERMSRRGEQQWMVHDRTRCGRIESQPASSRGSQGQRHVDVAAPMRMIMHAHAVDARVLARSDKVSHAGYGYPYWNAKVDL